jgi:hypothetical protein
VNKFTVGLNCFEGCNETAAAIRNRFSTRSVRKRAQRGAHASQERSEWVENVARLTAPRSKPTHHDAASTSCFVLLFVAWREAIGAMSSRVWPRVSV